MFNTIECYSFSGMIDPQEDSIISYSVFLKVFKIFGEIFKRISQYFRMTTEPLKLVKYSKCYFGREIVNVFFKFRSGLYFVHNSLMRSFRGLVFPEICSFLARRILSMNLGSDVRRYSSKSSSKEWNASDAFENFFNKVSGIVTVLDILTTFPIEFLPHYKLRVNMCQGFIRLRNCE